MLAAVSFPLRGVALAGAPIEWTHCGKHASATVFQPVDGVDEPVGQQWNVERIAPKTASIKLLGF